MNGFPFASAVFEECIEQGGGGGSASHGWRVSSACVARQTAVAVADAVFRVSMGAR